MAIHILDGTTSNKTVQEELTDDLMSIITQLSGELYGLKSKKHKELQQTIKEAITDVPDLSNQDKERSNRAPE